METKSLNDRMTEITAAPGRWLHRKDSDSYVRRVTVPTDRTDEWEEVEQAYSKAEYAKEVERLIALRYTTGQEIQFAREQEQAGDTYAEYLAYVEECKATAQKTILQRYGTL